jgi:hypothetical protein
LSRLQTLLLISLLILTACGGDEDTDENGEVLPTIMERTTIEATPEITEETEPVEMTEEVIAVVTSPTETEETPETTEIVAETANTEATDQPATATLRPPDRPRGTAAPPVASATRITNPDVENIVPGGLDDNFSLSVSGYTEFTADEGTSSYSRQPDPTHYTLVLFAGELEFSRQVTFEFGTEINPGTYDLTGGEDYIEGEVIARYSDSDSRTDMFIRFTDNLTGTLTLETVGQTISGSYEFTAETTSEEGNTLTATVTGVFTDVPIQN